MTGTLKRVCAWCKADMGTKPCAPENDGKTSHGMCDLCLAAERATLKALRAMSVLPPEPAPVARCGHPVNADGSVACDCSDGAVYGRGEISDADPGL